MNGLKAFQGKNLQQHFGVQFHIFRHQYLNRSFPFHMSFVSIIIMSCICPARKQIRRNLCYNGGGNDHGKGTAHIQLALHQYLTAHGVCKQFADRHAKTRSFDLTGILISFLTK